MLQQHSGVKLLPVVSAKKVLKEFYFMLTIKVSLRSSHIKNDKTVDAREHFYVSRCLLFAMKIHHIKSRYFSFSDRFYKIQRTGTKSSVSPFSQRGFLFLFRPFRPVSPKIFFFTHSSNLVRNLEKICDNCAATDTQFIMLSDHAESSCMKNITTIIFYKLGAK